MPCFRQKAKLYCLPYRPTDPLQIILESAAKRARNTQAARRSRAKKMEKFGEQEMRIGELESYIERLREQVRSLGGTPEPESL